MQVPPARASSAPGPERPAAHRRHTPAPIGATPCHVAKIARGLRHHYPAFLDQFHRLKVSGKKIRHTTFPRAMKMKRDRATVVNPKAVFRHNLYPEFFTGCIEFRNGPLVKQQERTPARRDTRTRGTDTSDYCPAILRIGPSRSLAINSCPCLDGCIVSQKSGFLSSRSNASSRSIKGTSKRAANRRID